MTFKSHSSTLAMALREISCHSYHLAPFPRYSDLYWQAKNTLYAFNALFEGDLDQF